MFFVVNSRRRKDRNTKRTIAVNGRQCRKTFVQWTVTLLIVFYFDKAAAELLNCQQQQYHHQGHSQEFATGGGRGQRGSLGMEVPSGVQGQSPGGDLGVSSQKPETNANFQLRQRGHAAMSPLGYTTDHDHHHHHHHHHRHHHHRHHQQQQHNTSTSKIWELIITTEKVDITGSPFFCGKCYQIPQCNLWNSAALLSPNTLHSAASRRCCINWQHFKVKGIHCNL